MKSKHYLSRNLIRVLLVFLISLFFVSQLIILYMNYQDSKLELDNKIITYVSGLEKPIGEAVWDYDNEQIKAMGDTFFYFPEIKSVEISDYVTGIVYKRDFEMKGNSFDIKYHININDETIATLKLVYTNELLLDELRVEFLIALLVFIIICIVIVYYIRLFTKKVIKPLSALSVITKEMCENLNEPIILETESDELNQLIKNFEEMRLDMLNYVRVLKELNSELEEKVEERTSALNDKNNELTHTINKLIETEEDIMRAAKVELTQRLVAGVAHELSTPIGNAITLTTFLAERLKDVDLKDDRIADSLLMIYTALEKSVKLIEKFKALDIRDQLNVTTFANVKSLIDTIVKKVNLGGCGLIVSEGQMDDCSINTKPFILMEVIKELLMNVCEHAYTSKENKRVEISQIIEEGYVKIQIKDFGKGLTNKSKIFEPFIKDLSSSDGSGLGLSIVENLVINGLDGEIQFTSMKNQGTTFTLTLRIS